MMNSSAASYQIPSTAPCKNQYRLTHEEMELALTLVRPGSDPSYDSLTEPRVKKIIRQRKGRWIKEEEEWAEFLSDEFYKGHSPIEGEQVQVTKRSYMSEKLVCAPMRISKKFKGTNKGKDVFTRKEGSEEAEQLHYKQKHVDLEKKFIKAVLQSLIKGGVKKEPAPSPVYIHGMQMANASFAGAVSPANAMGRQEKAVAQVPAPSQKHKQLVRNQLNPISAGFVPLTMASAYRSTSVGMQSVASQDAKSTSRPPSVSVPPSNQATKQPSLSQAEATRTILPAQVTAPSSSQEAVKSWASAVPGQAPCSATLKPFPLPALQMQMATGLKPTYSNQLDAMMVFNEHGAVGLNPSLLYQAQAISSGNHSVTCPNDYFGIQNMPNANEVPKKRQMAEQSFPPMLQTVKAKRFKPIKVDAAASHAVSTSASEPSSNDDSGNATSPNEASINSNASANLCGVNEMNVPDLLSGFDRHVSSTMKTNAGVTMKEDAFQNRLIAENPPLFAGAGVGESPYITSKSFDDLHRFLGKGLSVDKIPHLDLNQSYLPQMPAVQAQPNHPFGRSLSNSSDLTASD